MAQLLVVDDSHSMRHLVVNTLLNAEHDIKSAADGLEALNIAKSSTFDAVITDLNMPVMDGITLVKELRQLPQYYYIPILLLTTESSEEKKIAGKKAGATGWIVKPFQPEKLVGLVDRVVN